jgi:hypothetical protein
MEDFMKKVLAGLLLTCVTSSAFAQYYACKREYYSKVKQIQKRRAGATAFATGVAVIAVSPLVTPLGAITFGAFAVTLVSANQGKNLLNNRGILLPDAVKELMLIDEVLNPGKTYFLDADTNHVLFGTTVGAHYEIMPETKRQLMEKFVDDLRSSAEDKADLVTEFSVRLAIKDLLRSEELCQNARGKTKALSLRKFRKTVLEAII